MLRSGHGWTDTWLIMPWVLGVRCREFIYTGDTIGAEEAFRLGQVNRVFPKSELRLGLV